jgi:hypothetical protein
LACVESTEEQQFLANLKGTGRRAGRVVWLGGYMNRSGKWQWLNGNEIPPADVTCQAAGRYCLAYTKDTGFAARPPSGKANLAAKRIHGFICEWDQ